MNRRFTRCGAGAAAVLAGALLAGCASGQLEGGRHLAFPENTPISNLLLAMLHKIGAPVDSIGDSTELLEI